MDGNIENASSGSGRGRLSDNGVMFISDVTEVFVGGAAAHMKAAYSQMPDTPGARANGEAVSAAREELKVAGASLQKNLLAEYAQSTQALAGDQKIDFTKPENLKLLQNDRLTGLKKAMESVAHNSALPKNAFAEIRDLLNGEVHRNYPLGYRSLSARTLLPEVPAHLSSSVSQYNALVQKHQINLDAIRETRKTFESSDTSLANKATLSLGAGMIVNNILDRTVLGDTGEKRSLWAIASDFVVPTAAGLLARRITPLGVFAATVASHVAEKLIVEPKKD